MIFVTRKRFDDFKTYALNKFQTAAYYDGQTKIQERLSELESQIDNLRRENTTLVKMFKDHEKWKHAD